jgi:hypothetical protein
MAVGLQDKSASTSTTTSTQKNHLNVDFSTCIGYYGTLYAGKNRKEKIKKRAYLISPAIKPASPPWRNDLYITNPRAESQA